MKTSLLLAFSLVCVSFAQEKPSPAVTAGLRPFIESGKIAGVVTAVVNTDGIVSLNCEGYADIATKREMKPETMFWIASMTKYFTATAFMMLWDEGKVGLDDPVGKYIPSMSTMWVETNEKDGTKTLVRAKNPITMRQLLSHTSGLRFLAPCQSPTLGILPLDELTKEYAGLPLLFQPGEKYAYSNAGIDTIGRVIEVVSGMSFEQFLRVRILEPLGMKDTTFFPTKEQYGRMATVYEFDKESKQVKKAKTWVNLSALDAARHYAEPGGGLFSTAPDIAKFSQMTIAGGVYQGKRFLSEKAIAEISRKQCGEKIQKRQGLCCQFDEDGNWSKGGMLGTIFSFNRKQKIAMVWMVQSLNNEWIGKAGYIFSKVTR